ncbi:peroxisomal membrane protein PEX14 isoform X3 [Arachis ipaensis]|uniref:peroxisomal membrane protein PEX14 isoform X3 n=1 Tax=Arachis ipaensis TaxID=130454 RepID=UPI0007AFA45C|nr:peroxisomal membrane protein PEX14 isoform X3 [Arachis ipaensis]XP_025629131.1 peroxisomal membrane protein PEX14 isoform X3 [Arachis hypogaea]
MATQSPTQNQNQGAESAEPAANVDQQGATEEPVKQSSTPLVFVNSEPMREEQVQNAVKFLSHPKVKGSPVMYRRSFLERKGLTKEEIDEAFRRVPDSAPTVQTGGVTQDGQVKSSSNIQQQAQPQALQPGLPASAGVNTSSATLSRSRFHWSHALIAIGVLAASGAGTAIVVKNSILPRLKSWIRKVVVEEDDEELKKLDRKPTLVEEAAQAAKSAAAAAADVAKASQDMLISKEEERKHFVEVVSLLDMQVQEMKSMTNALRRIEAQEDLRVTQTNTKQLIVNGKADYDLHSVRSTSPPVSYEPPSSLHPKSYMEPWEVSQVQNSSTQVPHAQGNGEYLNSKVQDSTQSNGDGDDALPWWQRKNARIREIGNETEYNGNGSSYGVASNQPPPQRTWVPPQPPPIAMAEAAEAIRRPKPAAQKDQMSDTQSVGNSSDVSDEVTRIPRRSESEGAVEGGSSSSIPSTVEIQEDQELRRE